MSQYPETVGGRWRARVLVVNDDLRLAESVRSLLADEGYDTRIARDGLAAIEVLSEWTADLVLLDLMMPHLNGWDFLAKRAHDPLLARSLVVVWSVAPPYELARARELGADACLPGGATAPDDLLEVVSDVLTRGPGSPSVSYSTSAPLLSALVLPLLGFANFFLILRLYAQTPQACAVPTTSADAAGSVNARTGQEFGVVLMSQPGTGYSWSISTEPDPLVAVGVDSVALPPATSLLGAPGRECFRFMATGAGTTSVGFSYARSFESGVPPAQSVDVQVTVTSSPPSEGVPVQLPLE